MKICGEKFESRAILDKWGGKEAILDKVSDFLRKIALGRG